MTVDWNQAGFKKNLSKAKAGIDWKRSSQKLNCNSLTIYFFHNNNIVFFYKINWGSTWDDPGQNLVTRSKPVT